MYTCHDMGISVKDVKDAKTGTTNRTITEKEPGLTLHPSIFFNKPVYRVHVHLVDEHTGKVFWDAAYTVGSKGNRNELGTKLMSTALPEGGDKQRMDRICVRADDPQVHRFHLTVETLDDPLADRPNEDPEGQPENPLNGRDEGFGNNYTPEQIEFEAVRLPVFEKDGEPEPPITSISSGSEPSYRRMLRGKWNKYCARAQKGGCASWGYPITDPYEQRIRGQVDDFEIPGKIIEGTGRYSKVPISLRVYYDHIVSRAGRMYSTANPYRYSRALRPPPMSPMNVYHYPWWKTDPKSGAKPVFPNPRRPNEFDVRSKEMEAAMELQKEPPPPPQKPPSEKIPDVPKS